MRPRTIALAFLLTVVFGCEREPVSKPAPVNPPPAEWVPPGKSEAPRAAGDGKAFWPDVEYDAAVPTIDAFFGRPSGDDIARPPDMVDYLRALADARPDRMKVVTYGKTWEGRELVYAVIASKENLARIDELRETWIRLADPRRTSEAEAEELARDLPALVWLAYGIHGNEISSPEAALVAAHHLIAAQSDAVVDGIMENTVVIIDPLQNPDGRARFVHQFEAARGPKADASPLAAEHDEPWPRGRTNHYLFDLNRDWFALTQIESQTRIKALRHWRPTVSVDLHEMGRDSTFYFPPPPPPNNPYQTRHQVEAQAWFGENNARRFDQFGFDYFSRDKFDAFYPGYGTTWPSYYGAVSMLYEQASARGLVVRRTDDDLLTLRHGIHRHFVASIATAEAAAEHRERLLLEFFRYGKTGISDQADSTRAYLLPRRGDTSAVDKLAAILAEHGVEVQAATEEFSACGGKHPAGTYLVGLRQPAQRLARVLLDPAIPMDEDYMKEQERLRAKNLPDEIYDVTTWALPLMFNVEAVQCSREPRGPFQVVSPVRVPPGRVHGGKAKVAYLVPWGMQASARLLTAALADQIRVHSTDKEFKQGGRTFPRGTLIVKTAGNPEDLHERMEKLAQSTGAELFATHSGWVEEGSNFGSSDVFKLGPTRVALAWDRPTASYAAGATRFVLERQFGLPVTVIRMARLAGADLDRFDVLVLPDGRGYRRHLDDKAVASLKQWVSEGGTLIAVSGAVSFVAHPKVKIMDLAQEDLAIPKAAEKERGERAEARGDGKRADGGKGTDKKRAEDERGHGRVPGVVLKDEAAYAEAIRPKSELPDSAPGTLVRATLDPDHWITAGLGEHVNAMLRGRKVFSPLRLDQGVNAALFAAPDKVVVSGYLWQENRDQLAYKPLVAVQPKGRGFVIAFSSDPNYRAYVDGMNLLFINAVFRGAAHARPQE
jgi:hypothetical protein